MNIDLRRAWTISFRDNSSTFIEYLRMRGAYTHDSFDSSNRRSWRGVNPYWYGSCLEFTIAEKLTRDLLAARSLKPSRLREILDTLTHDPNSPVVRLTGIYLSRRLASELNPTVTTVDRIAA